jgi:hypothetical protein
LEDALRRRLIIAALSIGLGAPAAADELAKYSAGLGAAPAGRIYHYLRSNIDGSEPERVSVFHREPLKLEVNKAVQKCTNSALVTADLDPVLPMAVRLVGGRLQPNAKHVEFAWLTYEPKSRRLTAKVAPPGQPPEEKSLELGEPPFHVFDFDLASLTVVTPRLKDPRSGFAFEMPLIWLGEDGWSLKSLGRAEAVFERQEAYGGKSALRFRMEGMAFGGKAGTLWLDADSRHVLAAEWPMPNHAEYKDFKLVLTGIDDGGPAAWDRLLRAHFEGCPSGG